MRDTSIKQGFQITNFDPKEKLVVVENIAKGIRYEFPDEFEHINSAEIFNNQLLIIESKDGRIKTIQLLG